MQGSNEFKEPSEPEKRDDQANGPPSKSYFISLLIGLIGGGTAWFVSRLLFKPYLGDDFVKAGANSCISWFLAVLAFILCFYTTYKNLEDA